MGYYWKGMYSDGSGVTTTIPAVPATLYLADPVTVSGALEYVIIRARASGTAGNGVQFRMQVGTLSDTGEIVEDTLTSQVTVLFNDGDRVGDIISLINVSSTLVEAVGSWNPSDALIDGEDDFDYLDLEHGVDAITGIRAAFWGPHYPDWATSPVVFVPGSGPPGVATFALLEGSATVHYMYRTDVFKSYDGKEKRAALLDDPEQTFGGTAYLVGENAVDVRTQLARFAALGSTFQLALPYEELTIVDDADSLTVPVSDTSTSDWANVGQRVVVVDRDGNSVAGVIQTVNADSLELDVVAGAIGQAGSRIMPTVPVVLEPAQGFSRYPVVRSVTATGALQVESWTVAARGITAGFEVAAQVGILALAPLVGGTALALIILRGVTTGVGISLSFEANDPSVISGVELGVAADDDGNLTIAVRAASGATAGEFVAALTASGFITVGGEWTPDAVIIGSDDFALTPFTGESDGGPPDPGRGATIAEFDGRPIFDRGIDVDGTAPDSMQAMNEIIELGAFPLSIGTATRPDWGRSISLSRSDFADWQWFKKFMATVRGRQRAFWLPTFREDLLAVGDGPGGGTTGDLTIDNTYGDYTYWSADHANLMIVQGEETYYATVTGATDNLDGTTTLAIDTGGPTIPVAAAVDLISWLELCRFESDDIAVEHRNATFTVKTTARVVQQ